jgi:hypothetical protein
MILVMVTILSSARALAIVDPDGRRASTRRFEDWDSLDFDEQRPA